jgi:hypothetical protein
MITVRVGMHPAPLPSAETEAPKKEEAAPVVKADPKPAPKK